MDFDFRSVGVVVLACLLLGCGGKEEGKGASEDVEEAAPEAAGPGQPGVLEGRVTFAGTPPPPRRIQVNKDVEHCGSADGQEVKEVEVSADGGLKGAVVEILGITRSGGWDWKHPADGYAIRQKGCRFLPHFQVVPHGSELAIYNDDPVLHNINTGAWNIAQIAGSPPMKRAIRFRGRPLVRVNCNVHSWMEAWIYVARSPFHAVSDDNGGFRIGDVPPGSYRATAVHPALGEQRFRIEVESGETVRHDVAFEAR